MNGKNIPHHDKFNALVEGLTELEPFALDLSRDAIHAASPHIAPLLVRLRGCIESLRWHAKFLAEAPDPKPETANPKLETAPDAKAGTPPAQ